MKGQSKGPASARARPFQGLPAHTHIPTVLCAFSLSLREGTDFSASLAQEPTDSHP